MTSKQKKIADCLEGWIDEAYWPNYSPTTSDWELFFKVETHGRGSVSQKDLGIIKPLLEAKGDYDLQIKMIYSECAEWWSKGWGWAAPIESLMKNAKGVYLDALTKIHSAFSIDSFAAIMNFTGFDGDEKNRYLKGYEVACAEQIQLCRK